MGEQLDRAQAWALLTEFNQDPFHLHHARTVEGVMRYFAQELGYGDEVDFWGIVGLLHDLDFERYPDQHCIRSQEIMRERGLDERLIHATASHGYGITVDIVPEHEMEKPERAKITPGRCPGVFAYKIAKNCLEFLAI